MREDIDQMQLEEKLKQKKKEKELADANKTCLQREKEEQMKDDTISVMTTGSTGS